jgi:hypothetical protein
MGVHEGVTFPGESKYYNMFSDNIILSKNGLNKSMIISDNMLTDNMASDYMCSYVCYWSIDDMMSSDNKMIMDNIMASEC